MRETPTFRERCAPGVERACTTALLVALAGLEGAQGHIEDGLEGGEQTELGGEGEWVWDLGADLERHVAREAGREGRATAMGGHEGSARAYGRCRRAARPNEEGTAGREPAGADASPPFAG